jgi:hypothetical protein
MLAETPERVRHAALFPFVAGLLIALQPRASSALDITLAWSPSSDPAVIGYNLYFGPASHTYTNMIQVGGANLATISNLVRGAMYFFAATSYDARGLESDYSDEASYGAITNVFNLPPTLDPLVDVALPENAGPQIINLTGISSGSPTEIQTLTLSAYSSNPALIPNPSVTYSSPDPYGSISFTPVPDMYGSAVVTVVVDDGVVVSNTIMRSFKVTVTPIHGGPMLNSLGDLTLTENCGLTAVTLTGIGSGSPSGLGTLTVTATSSNPPLIPDPQIDYTSPGWSATLWLTPSPNVVGTTVITVTVNNEQAVNNTLSHTFTVTVNPPPAPWTILWQHASGATAAWVMNGTNSVLRTSLNAPRADPGWSAVACGALSGSGQNDLLWQSSSGWIGLWLMDSTNLLKTMRLNSVPVTSGWQIAAVGDFGGPSHNDLLWQSTTGWVGLWLMNGTNSAQTLHLNSVPVLPDWNIVGAGDFDGDGQTDILWQSTSGWVALWLMNGTNFIRSLYLNGTPVGGGWNVTGVADVDGDGHPDLLWRKDDGTLAYWLMQGTTYIRSGRFNPAWADPGWKIVGCQPGSLTRRTKPRPAAE